MRLISWNQAIPPRVTEGPTAQLPHSAVAGSVTARLAGRQAISELHKLGLCNLEVSLIYINNPST